MIFMVVIMFVLVLAGFALMFLSPSGSKKKASQQSKSMMKLYHFLSNFFITQGSTLSIYRKLASLSVYKRDELQVLTVKYITTSWGISGVLIIISLFMFQDFITTLMVVAFSFLLSNIIVDKRLDGASLKVLKALSNAISSIRQEYLNLNNVVEALNSADVPVEVRRPIEEIANILVETNSEFKLQEFIESTPYRTLQTLAGVCHNISNQGDERDENGQSAFILALTLMLSDTNSAIQKSVYRKKRFGFIEYLPFLPIFGMGAIESYFVSIMPGTALVYDGPMGYLFRTTTVLVSIISYSIISRVNMSIPIKEDDRSPIIMSMLEKSRVKRFIINITPKNRARRRLDSNLKASLSRMSVEHFYMKKLIIAVLAISVSLLTMYSAVSLGRSFLTHSTQQLSLVSTGKQTPKMDAEIKNLDKVYLANPTKYTDTNAMQGLITNYIPGLTDLQIQDQERRLQNKLHGLQSAYFHWWFIWIAVVLGLIGWNGPNIMLKIRELLVRTEEEDDFIQLQTLMSILINTNIDTLDMLGELARFSRVHKDMFMYAYQGYPSNPDLELTRLRSKTPLVDFKRFIDKLRLSVSDLSLKDAFSDLLIEREHILRLRDMAITASIDRKRSLCGPISMAPLAVMIIGQFLVPIGILGYHEFMNALSTMTG